MRLRLLLFFFPLLLFPAAHLHAAAPSTKGTEFWVSFMENLDLSSNGMPQFSFEISCDVNASGIISIPATGYTQNFSAAGGQVTEVFLPPGVFYHIGSESIDNSGFRVTTNNPVQLRVMHHRFYFSDATIVLPTPELGDQYLLLAHSDDLNTGGLSEFVVEATEDNTTVDIIPSALTVGLRPAGISFSVTLNKGQTYQVQSYSDLSGTSVAARNGKKIAVFSGAKFANVACTATNHLFEENHPVSRWGKEYVVAPFIPSNGTLFRILAAENGTQVYFNCNPPMLLNKGQYFDTILFNPTRITSTHSVAVGQYKLGQDCSSQGDATFLVDAPLAFTAHKATFAPIISAVQNYQFSFHYVNVIVATANAAFTTYDNSPITFFPVPSNPAWSSAHITLAPGVHTLLSDSGFYAYAFGVGPNDSYSYSLGYDDTRSSVSLLAVQSPDTLCSGTQADFTSTATFPVTAWNWQFGNGASSALQNPSYTYAQNGIYSVTLLVTDANNCPSIAEHIIHINSCMEGFDCEIFVPTAFSPNDDGVNEMIGVNATCIREMDFKIYDRWGELVFESKDQSKYWDGTYKGIALDNSVFAWTLTATSYSGQQIVRKGNITLIR